MPTTQRALKKVSIIGQINKKEIQLNPHRVCSPSTQKALSFKIEKSSACTLCVCVKRDQTIQITDILLCWHGPINFTCEPRCTRFQLSGNTNNTTTPARTGPETSCVRLMSSFSPSQSHQGFTVLQTGGFKALLRGFGVSKINWHVNSTNSCHPLFPRRKNYHSLTSALPVRKPKCHPPFRAVLPWEYKTERKHGNNMSCNTASTLNVFWGTRALIRHEYC